ncbi:hypothetical protein A0O34_03515 [Chryseobacterium glaciei]|uniref:Uncharacterized protein n=1 Tax=Chryseobacterium glaciei TaxID=1685010 RepID=A0A172XRV3_9FLAO|nr:DUF6000 family protein [Chryseobacterium glaciei]ANF49664.1 hypothetical protein A0O34_03515 [Chryseobacterium glaciei]
MNDDLKNQIKLHSAGATVRHWSVFEHLKSHRNDFELDQEFINKWVLPFYMKIRSINDTSWIENIKQLKDEITEEVTLALLGDFNWRTRLVGAYLSAIKNYENQIDIIGVHLLKSEVCYVGDLYSLVFTFYNQPKTREYLNQYLNHYLQKPELYFDQDSVLESIIYLDKVNDTNDFSKHLESWKKMNESRNELSKIRNLQVAKILEEQEGKDKSDEYIKAINGFIPNHDLNIQHISKQIEILKELREYCK